MLPFYGDWGCPVPRPKCATTNGGALYVFAAGSSTQAPLKVSTLTRDERLVRLNDGELALANALMRKTMLTADEQAQLGVLVWKMGQGSTGKEISAQSVSVDAKNTGS